MFPTIPNFDLSWPITQHSGVISKEVITGLLNSCVLMNGLKIDSDLINSKIIACGILTNNYRTDSNKIDAWRDYQQILSELGLIYSTRVTNNYIILTPIAVAFLDGSISYEELITLQLLKYQYPNGHKTQLSPSFKQALPSSLQDCSFAEIQSSYGILLRPAVLIFQILVYLLEHHQAPSLTVDELQIYAVRCLTNSDADICAQSIIQSRKEASPLRPLPRARRNIQDWIKLLAQSPIFRSVDFRSIELSDYAIEHLTECRSIIKSLLKPESYWLFSARQDYKKDWFAFYGNINLGLEWINIEDSLKYTNSQYSDNISNDENTPHYKSNIVYPSSVNLRTYSPTRHLASPSSNTIISEYDYKDSQKGYYLHDSMVDFIAHRCASKGAEVYEDKQTIDLFVKFESKEFLIEVKSITPSNFIKRLRFAIGQVNQYDYLIKPNTHRRLGLAFTADIPAESWVIPFVTNHLNMDLLTMANDNLKVISNDSISRLLFST